MTTTILRSQDSRRYGQRRHRNRRSPGGYWQTGKKTRYRNAIREQANCGQIKTTKKPSAAGQKPDNRKTTSVSTPADKPVPRRKKPAGATAGKVRKRATAAPVVTVKNRKSTKPATEKVHPSHGGTPREDPRSLAWMAESAVQALNAVKASQTKKARALLENAQREKLQTGHQAPENTLQQLPPKPAHVNALAEPETQYREGDTAATPGNTLKPEIQAAPDGTGMTMSSPTPKPAHQSVDAALDNGNDDQKPSDDIPVRSDSQNAVDSSNTENPGVPEQQIESGETLSVSPLVQQHRTQTSASRFSWWRPGAIAFVLIIAGWFGFQWLPQEEDGDAALNRPQDMPVTGQPPRDEPATPAEGTIIKSTDSDRSYDHEWTPALLPGKPEPEPASSRKPLATGNTPPHTTPVRNTPVSGDSTPGGDPAETGKSATSPANQPADVTKQQTTRHTMPRPASRTTGYGYYPQQPAWRQPYYRPGYSNYPPR